ncbi:MAG: division/cell wall cluster transcriptional repressor MraZ [Candidatus Sungbacteria bacterium]|nr:division/cell wall cluster transcriptional repressor MraZ [Candidatus Sungbacteria bacterium]
MFIGEYAHSVDNKGRMAIPAKFRKLLQEGVVVTRGIDPHLYLFPAEEWAKLAEKIAKLPITQADSRAFSRHMLGGASDAEIDSQGRILIPEYLRGHADIKNQAVVVGLYDRVEIWSDQRWQEHKAKIGENTQEIAERLGELGSS